MHTCSFRTTRGYTVVAACCDELAFWRGEDSSNPDDEIINAIKPAMATIPNAMLLVCVMLLTRGVVRCGRHTTATSDRQTGR